MTSFAFRRAIEHVFLWEGGYSDHAADPGGATNFGITRRTLANWRGESVSKEDVRKLTRAEAAEIYEKTYWRAIKGDELPPAIAFVLLDAAVNSGPSAAVKTLQKALATLTRKPIKSDGLMGPRTLAAVNDTDPEKLLNEFIVRRGVFYGGLRTFATFGLGWARRLVSAARAAHSLLKTAPLTDGSLTPPAAPSVKPAVSTDTRLPADLDIRRHFFDERGVQVYGTFFALWGGWMTAGHVMTQMLRTSPPFAKGEQTIEPGRLDAAMIGCTLPDLQPPEPREGQRVVVAGYPAGSQALSVRYGEVYMKRPSTEAWIATIDQPSEPVVVGMSGGAVADADTGEIIGVLVTRNSPADIDSDGRMDQNCDFVSLSAIWATVNHGMALA